MPKTPTEVEHFSQSVRFTVDEAAWVREEARRVGSFAAVVREAVNDQRTLYDLPPNQVAKLDADAKRLNMRRREYVKYLLALRYEAILMGELEEGGRAGPGKVGKR